MPQTIHYNDENIPDGTPTYLFDHADTYAENARTAGLDWFLEAALGVSVGYGLFSLVGHPEDTRGSAAWKPGEYQALKEKFTCARFDPSEIVEMAIAAGARYLVFPARLRDGFCLFNTRLTDFSSVNSPARRDLVGEIASLCEYHGLGLILRYNCGHDENFIPPEPTEDDWARFEDFIAGQLRELLTEYGPIAGLSLEGADSPMRDKFQDFYDYIHSLQPQTLVAFQQGCLGTEDFHSVHEKLPGENSSVEDKGCVLDHPDKPVEIRLNLTPSGRAFDAQAAGKHRKFEELWEHLRTARQNQANLLLNTSLMPDGSLDLEDLNTLLAIGERLEKQGYPR